MNGRHGSLAAVLRGYIVDLESGFVQDLALGSHYNGDWRLQLLSLGCDLEKEPLSGMSLRILIKTFNTIRIEF